MQRARLGCVEEEKIVAAEEGGLKPPPPPRGCLCSLLVGMGLG